MTRKMWEKPKLVVLVRGRPEEAVLQVCKYNGRTGPVLNNCLQRQGYSTVPCQTQTAT
jgi:hypothetical protein